MQGLKESMRDGRYNLLLVGLFYVHSVYKEAFAVPLDLFGSRWRPTNDSTMAAAAVPLPAQRPWPACPFAITARGGGPPVIPAVPQPNLGALT